MNEVKALCFDVFGEHSPKLNARAANHFPGQLPALSEHIDRTSTDD